MYELLEKLCAATGTPGRENSVMDVIERELSGFSHGRDALGNLIVTAVAARGGQKTVLLEAHADRIGLVAMALCGEGFVRVSRAGGIDPATLMGSEIVFEGKNGPVPAVISAPFPYPAKPHNSAPAADYEMPETDALFVDTGRAELAPLLRPGAPATVCGGMFRLLGSRVAAPGLDNRISCAVLIETARRLAQDKPGIGVTLLFSTREEVGGQGAATGAFERLADWAIAVDTAFALSPDTQEKDCSEMGKGPEIGISPSLHGELTDFLLDTAQKNEIPFQTTVFGRTTGTDADHLATVAGGIRTALVSVPIRFMHHPVETADLDDAEQSVRLLTAAIGGLSHV